MNTNEDTNKENDTKTPDGSAGESKTTEQSDENKEKVSEKETEAEPA